MQNLEEIDKLCQRLLGNPAICAWNQNFTRLNRRLGDLLDQSKRLIQRYAELKAELETKERQCKESIQGLEQQLKQASSGALAPAALETKISQTSAQVQQCDEIRALLAAVEKRLQLTNAKARQLGLQITASQAAPPAPVSPPAPAEPPAPLAQPIPPPVVIPPPAEPSAPLAQPIPPPALPLAPSAEPTAHAASTAPLAQPIPLSSAPSAEPTAPLVVPTATAASATDLPLTAPTKQSPTVELPAETELPPAPAEVATAVSEATDQPLAEGSLFPKRGSPALKSKVYVMPSLTESPTEIKMPPPARTFRKPAAPIAPSNFDPFNWTALSDEQRFQLADPWNVIYDPATPGDTNLRKNGRRVEPDPLDDLETVQQLLKNWDQVSDYLFLIGDNPELNPTGYGIADQPIGRYFSLPQALGLLQLIETPLTTFNLLGIHPLKIAQYLGETYSRDRAKNALERRLQRLAFEASQRTLP